MFSDVRDVRVEGHGMGGWLLPHQRVRRPGEGAGSSRFVMMRKPKGPFDRKRASHLIRFGSRKESR